MPPTCSIKKMKGAKIDKFHWIPSHIWKNDCIFNEIDIIAMDSVLTVVHQHKSVQCHKSASSTPYDFCRRFWWFYWIWPIPLKCPQQQQQKAKMMKKLNLKIECKQRTLLSFQEIERKMPPNIHMEFANRMVAFCNKNKVYLFS